MKRVVVLGSAIMDVMAKSGKFKVLRSHQVKGGIGLCEVYGGKMELDDLQLAVGGAGTNVAVGLSRLGIVTATVVRVGGGMMGRMVVDSLRLEGVETGLVQVDKKGRTGISVILVAGDGGRSIMTYRGVSREIAGREIDWGKLKAADWIQISSLGGNMSLLEDVVAFARKNKVKVGLNPGKLELAETGRLKGLLAKVELLVVNRMEAAMLLGDSFIDTDETFLVKKLVQRGPKLVAVTSGKQGASLTDGKRLIRMDAFKVKSVDDTGAGDAFCSGLVRGVVQGQGLEGSLRMGVSNGASEVTKLGAKTGLLYSKQMKSWLRKRLKVVEEKI